VTACSRAWAATPENGLRCGKIGGEELSADKNRVLKFKQKYIRQKYGLDEGNPIPASQQ
jgi:hypothetical protein